MYIIFAYVSLTENRMAEKNEWVFASGFVSFFIHLVCWLLFIYFSWSIHMFSLRSPDTSPIFDIGFAFIGFNKEKRETSELETKARKTPNRNEQQRGVLYTHTRTRSLERKKRLFIYFSVFLCLCEFVSFGCVFVFIANWFVLIRWA